MVLSYGIWSVGVNSVRELADCFEKIKKQKKIKPYANNWLYVEIILAKIGARFGGGNCC